MTEPIDDRLQDYAARWNAEHREVDDLPLGDALRFAGGTTRPRRMVPLVAAAAAVALLVGGGVWVTRHHATDPATAPPPAASTEPVASTTPATSTPARTTDPAITATWTPAVPGSTGRLTPLAATVAAPTLLGASPGTRSCQGADFRLVSSRTVPRDDGWLSTAIVLRSTGRSACALQRSYFVGSLVDAKGDPLPIDAAPAGPAFLPETLWVQPGDLTFGSVSWAVVRGKAATPVWLALPIGDGRNSPRVSLEGVAIPPDPHDPSNLGPWRSTAFGQWETVVRPGSLGSLSASVQAPATAALGRPLEYTATLTNLTGTQVSLATCPRFVQSAQVVPWKTPVVVASSGRLNCAGLPASLAPGQTVTLELQIGTTGLVAGAGSVSWQLLDDLTPALTATAAVRFID